MARRHRFSRYLKILVFLGDILVFNGLFLSLYFTGHFIINTFQFTGQFEESWLLFLFVLNASWLIIIFYTNPYKVTRVFKLNSVVGDITYTVFQHFLVTCTAIYLLDFQLVHKWGPPVVYSGLLAVMILWRLSFYYGLSLYRSRGYNFRNVVIVGYGQVSRQLELFFQMHPEHGYRIVGFFDDKHTGNLFKGKIADLESFLKETTVDEIYCCLSYVRYGEIKRIIDFGEEKLIKVKLLTDFRAFSSKGLELERYDHIPVLNVSSIPLDDRKNQIIKRSFDILFSLAFLIFIFSWLYPVIAILIRIGSKGPIFFRQTRTGKDNDDFLCLKFRTMYLNAESDQKQASQNDPRITPIGAFLRSTSLDELPQFINVLKGDMSIVGPRPHMLRHTEEYSKLIGKFMARHSVKPGITGLAQSMGYRGETKNLSDMKNRVKLDRFYIENWSLIFDVKIIIQTILSLFRGSEKAF